MSNLRLKSRVAIITGAASGIGRTTALRFLNEGAVVWAVDSDGEGLENLNSQICSSQLRTQVMDVRQQVSCKSLAEKVLEHDSTIDILVNSAGITPRSLDPSLPFEQLWQTVIDVNMKGTLLMSHAVLPAMRKSPGGSIINLASVMGMVSYHPDLPLSEGFNPYPHSKGGVIQMTRDLGVQLGPEGIRVNAVCPGFIYTPLTAGLSETPDLHEKLKRRHPLRRLGETEEVANVILFLASDEESFVIVAAWTVDGGYTTC